MKVERVNVESLATSLLNMVELCTAEVHVRSEESFGAERSREADLCWCEVKGRFWDGSANRTDKKLLLLKGVAVNYPVSVETSLLRTVIKSA